MLVEEPQSHREHRVKFKGHSVMFHTEMQDGERRVVTVKAGNLSDQSWIGRLWYDCWWHYFCREDVVSISD